MNYFVTTLLSPVSHGHTYGADQLCRLYLLARCQLVRSVTSGHGGAFSPVKPFLFEWNTRLVFPGAAESRLGQGQTWRTSHSNLRAKFWRRPPFPDAVEFIILRCSMKATGALARTSQKRPKRRLTGKPY